MLGVGQTYPPVTQAIILSKMTKKISHTFRVCSGPRCVAYKTVQLTTQIVHIPGFLNTNSITYYQTFVKSFF